MLIFKRLRQIRINVFLFFLFLTSLHLVFKNEHLNKGADPVVEALFRYLYITKRETIDKVQELRNPNCNVTSPQPTTTDNGKWMHHFNTENPHFTYQVYLRVSCYFRNKKN
jgi:hypothetical protein